MLDSELQRRFVQSLSRVPGTTNRGGRDALLVGLPPNVVAALNRDNNCVVDLLNITTQLDQLGRLEETGERPLIVVAKNALMQTKGTEIGKTIKEIMQELDRYYGGDSPPHSLYRLGRACDFDLDHLLRECLSTLLVERYGLVGFAVSYDDEAFQTNFFERLSATLKERDIQIRHPLTLTSKFTSVDEAIDIIRGCKGLLQSMDVLYPIRVQVSDDTIIGNFWQGLCGEYAGDFEHRLVIFMFTPEDLECEFPKGVRRLSPPQFEAVDAYQWICSVVHNVKWPGSATKKEIKGIIDTWIDAIEVECRLGDTLHVRRVYEHMEYTLTILRQNPTVDSFCARLKERRQIYASASH